ncbi:hypothetical protein C8F04DRAFT_1192959 [Mycena alexandri]|uniref:Uncharacterized protein n=1 Tax=Mycena alexandri TaxID=1745969 RepID=A0AAD6WSQ0_9AGAR|nr:hypothetical protein C8F04DRAFT_1192959 [Mycena alexandri]
MLPKENQKTSVTHLKPSLYEFPTSTKRSLRFAHDAIAQGGGNQSRNLTWTHKTPVRGRHQRDETSTKFHFNGSPSPTQDDAATVQNCSLVSSSNLHAPCATKAFVGSFAAVTEIRDPLGIFGNGESHSNSRKSLARFRDGARGGSFLVCGDSAITGLGYHDEKFARNHQKTAKDRVQRNNQTQREIRSRDETGRETRGKECWNLFGIWRISGRACVGSNVDSFRVNQTQTSDKFQLLGSQFGRGKWEKKV